MAQDMMRAALLVGKQDLQVLARPVPVPSDNQIVVRVLACGVCPTDLRKFNTLDGGRLELPMNLGHEYVGEVTGLGTDVRGLRLGQRVLGEGYAGYADYALIDLDSPQSVHRPEPLLIPQAISDGEATFTEPLADCVHAIRDRAAVEPGESVLIIGGGTMGQLLAMVANQAGARVMLSEPHAGRRATAERFGAQAIDPADENVADGVRRLNDGKLAQVVVLTIGIGGLIQPALEALEVRGRLVLFGGFPRPASAVMDPNVIHYRELTITGSEWAGAPPFWDGGLFRQALQLIESGRVPVAELISGSYELAQIRQAFAQAALMANFKIVVLPATKA
jgi:2-desacetyl-2-hydroxyethyl bacteriochlorophyllide A dehydrogenase